MRKTLATFALILSVAAAPHAQVKLDPRLGIMRSIWIEADDELTEAPAIADCFPETISAAGLPLKIEKEKRLSQVVFRFREVNRRVELSVNLHDGQQMWTVTAPLVDRGDSLKKQCLPAAILAYQLRDAMQSARDGIWYQPVSDPLIPGLAGSTALPEQETPAPPPPIETQYYVSGSTYQVIEMNRTFWRFSWKMTVKNYGPDNIVVSPTVEFKNGNGLIVDTGIGEMRTVGAQDTVEITGTSLIKAETAPTVTSVYMRATRIR